MRGATEPNPRRLQGYALPSPSGSMERGCGGVPLPAPPPSLFRSSFTVRGGLTEYTKANERSE